MFIVLSQSTNRIFTSSEQSSSDQSRLSQISHSCSQSTRSWQPTDFLARMCSISLIEQYGRSNVRGTRHRTVTLSSTHRRSKTHSVKDRRRTDGHSTLLFTSFRITKMDLISLAQTMYDSFFRILTAEKFYENEYVMRVVMRLSSALQEGVLPYLSQLMEKLVIILRRSSRVRIDHPSSLS